MSDVNLEFFLSYVIMFKSMVFRLCLNFEYKFNYDLGYFIKCENFDLGVISELFGGSWRLVKINKVFLLLSGSILSIGSSGGKDKFKKVLNLLKFCLYCFVRVFIFVVIF